MSPLALQIKGKIEGNGDIYFDKEIVYFLIPEPDFEKQQLLLKPDDQIQLWLSDKRKCFKIEKM